MEFDSTPLTKKTSDWTRGEKNYLLRGQYIVAFFQFFLAIVECTNLFIIDGWNSNPITLGFALVSLFYILFALLALFWTWRTQQNLAKSDDPNGDVTDNYFSRFILFLAIVITTTFSIFYIIYTFAQNDLINHFQAGHQEKELENYKNYLQNKRLWIHFLSILNIIFGIYTIFNSFSQTGSQQASRLQVYLLGIIILFLSFYEIDTIDLIRTTHAGGSINLDQWPYNTIFIIAITTVAFLVITFFVNAKRLRNAYLILGAFFLLAVILQVPSTGKIFREYNKVTRHYSENCEYEMGQIGVNQLESSGCPNKYHYRKSRAECPDEKNPTNCFQPFENCDKTGLSVVWEKDLVLNPYDTAVLGCLNSNCCGVVQIIYSNPILRSGAISLSFLFLTFVLACFCFNLSSRDKTEQQLNLTLQISLFAIFGIILIAGIFWVTLASFHQIEKRPSSWDFQGVQVSDDRELQHYPSAHNCEKFSQLIHRRTTDERGHPIEPAQYEALLYVPALNVTVNKIENLDSLIASSDDYCALGKCVQKGYLVGVETPHFFTTQQPAQAPAANASGTTPLHERTYTASFDYPDDIEEKEGVAVLAASTVRATIFGRADTDNDHNYFGIVGRQNIITILNMQLRVCDYRYAQGQAFTIKVLSVDLENYKNIIPKNNGAQLFEFEQIEQEPEVTQKSLPKHKSIQPHNDRSSHRVLASSPQARRVLFNVFDVTRQHAIEGARVLVFEYERVSSVWEHSRFLCQDLDENEKDQEGETDRNGVFAANFLTNQGTKNYLIYASADGFSTNCRIFRLNDQWIAYDNTLDIGLSPNNLQKDQTRIVLEWSNYFGEKDNEVTDLDLVVTFESQEVPEFLCEVSYLQHTCQGVSHHGDNVKSSVSSTTEAVTLYQIQRYDYLIYINRFIKGATAGKQNQNLYTVQGAQPILKYYTHDQTRPSSFREAYRSAKDSLVNGATGWDSSKKFSLISWCIKGTENNIQVINFKAGKDSVWADAETATSYYAEAAESDIPTNSIPVAEGQKAKFICGQADETDGVVTKYPPIV